jgi:5-methylcytosine-specific restriction endonuclease McrA
MQANILDQKLKSLVASERKITREILLLIQTLDITNSYRELGYSSLFVYLTKEIGYSEGAAQRRISSARLMKQVPVLEKELQSGSLNLTQASMLQAAIKQEERSKSAQISNERKEVILEQLKSKTIFESQKILIENFPDFKVPKPKTRPAGSGTIHVTMEFSEPDWQKVQDLMAHFSHSVPDQKLEGLLLYWHQQVEAKKEKQKEKVFKRPVARAAKDATFEKDSSHAKESAPISESTEIKITQNPKSPDSSPPLRRWRKSRRAVHCKPKIEIRERAQGQCEYISPLTRKRCESKHFLEIEHIIPVTKGGSNAPENLRLYCKSHNQLAAKLWGISQF